MGQAIVYCWKCQNRIVAGDFEAHRAFQAGGHTSCQACVGDLLRTLTGSDREALLSQVSRAAETPSRPDPSQKSTGRHAAMRDASHKTPGGGTRAVAAVPGPRSPLPLALGAAAVAILLILVIVAVSGGKDPTPTRSEAPPPPPPVAETDAARRQKAAEQAISKARAAAPSGLDIDAQIRLWNEAVAAAERTPSLADATRERDAAVARRKEVYDGEWAQVDASLKGLETQREYQRAVDFLKSARGRHEGPEWSQLVDRRLTGLAEKQKEAARIEKLVPQAGLSLWFRGDAGLTLDGDKVTAWADQSGGRHDATSSNPAQRPTFLPAGLNGRPCVRFDGAATVLNYTMAMNGLTGLTLVVVATCPPEKAGAGGSDASVIYWDETGTSGKIYLATTQTGVRFKMGTGKDKSDLTYARPSPLSGRPSLTLLRKEGTVDALYVDGALAKRQTGMGGKIANCSERAALGIGKKDTHYQGCVAEVLVYGRALSDAERDQVSRYLADKYALTLQ